MECNQAGKKHCGLFQILISLSAREINTNKLQTKRSLRELLSHLYKETSVSFFFMLTHLYRKYEY